MASKKYLKDYDLVETEDEKGRSKKTAVYHGDYFRLSLEESQIKQLKLQFILFFAAALALHVCAGLVNNPGLYKAYMAIPYTAAFLPLFFLSGMEGRMLKPLGISFIVSLTVSLVVAMTLTPLLSKMLLTNESYLAKNEREKWLSRNLQTYFKASLEWVLRHKKVVLGAVLSLVILSIVAFASMGRSFLPEFNEGSLTLSVVTKPGTSLDETNKLGNLVEQQLLAIPEIYSTARRTGRGELDEHSQTVNSSEIDVNFKLSERSRDEFVANVRQTLAGIPGIAATVGQPLGHRIDHMLSGTRANIH